MVRRDSASPAHGKPDDPLGWADIKAPLAVMAALGAAAGAVLWSSAIDSDLWSRFLLDAGLVGFLLPLWAVAAPPARRDRRSVASVLVALGGIVLLHALFGSWDISGMGFVLACVALMALHLGRRRNSG